MIHGAKIRRPVKQEMAESIAALCGLPVPRVSSGSSVESLFLDAVYSSITGRPSGAVDAYRKTEALLGLLALTYDPYWDTSEAATAGGSTVTNRAYSRINAALSATPRCFILNVTDAPVGARWELNHQDVYRYDDTVTGRGSLNDAGPGSRIVYYATGKSRHHPKHFIASATVSYISPGWHGPWAAELVDYTPFPAPVPVNVLELTGWNRQHAITEIAFGTYGEIVTAGLHSTEASGRPTAAPLGTALGALEPELGGARVAERVHEDFPAGREVPTLALPESLPRGIFDGGRILSPRYIETPDGVYLDDEPMSIRRQDSRRDKAVELRAIDIATKALEKGGWNLLADRQKDGVGYDLEFERAGDRLNVEVKGIVGDRLAFNITPKELWRAQTDTRWLLVAVTNVLTPRSFTLNVITRDRVAIADRAVTGYRLHL